ncbi:MAG: outer membrane protein assembly factor BamA [Gammaproteobacteria bacterium RIFCSPHIGHO2_12_FULL_38_14]|nr:MAG: outer membrane protein assembly factor BamA [Gammaproteobacteria bacterium RIFCSPHIGHO2_12_FULL_38_14]
MKKLLYFVLLLSQLICFTNVFAQAFVVKHIEIRGLQRISAQTVESYLPIKRGQTLQPAQTAAVLKALYRTEFFDRITLSRSGNTLIIDVVERPTIGRLKITGNSAIATDKLNTVMRMLDIAEGRVYNPAMIEKIKQSLLNQYYQLGRFNARVNVNVTPMPRDRVSVVINISEGLVAKIKRISIIGNHAFSEKKLLKQLDISKTGIFTIITQSDRYSEEKLNASLEKLRAFYMDHGYLRIVIKSAQAEITPDRKFVYVTIVVDEGEPYTVKNYELQGQNLIFSKDLITKQITIKPGETFSRQKILEAEKNITKLYGDHGYLFAEIALHPEVNDKTHDVILVFVINPGKRAYVRQITFSDNHHTNDDVLRRELQQLEAAPASAEKIEESKRRLSLLPYLRNVDIAVQPVPNKDDQVDVNYKVKEDSSAQATFKVGYEQQYGVILGAGFNQKNFLGTGDTFGMNLSRSKYENFYGIDFTNPYYTADGISRSFNFSFSQVDPSAGVNPGYTTNEYDMGVLYGIPVGQEQEVINRIQLGVGYQDTIVKLVPGEVSAQVNQYVTEHGTHFQELDMKGGFYRDSRDKAIFPTRGVLQTAFADFYAPLASGSVAYYMFNYQAKSYLPLNEEYILTGRADFGYGGGLFKRIDFPFFKNYFGGGINSVRGYEDFTLGLRDSNGNPMGGNILADASIGLIFPNYLSENLRTSLFFDAGNVFNSYDNKGFGGQSQNSGPVRFSTGVEADILTPFGPIELSVAKPLNLQRGKDGSTAKGDQEKIFQFALGVNF